MSDEEIKAKLRAFMSKFAKGSVSDDERMFETGAANSLFAMQLVTFLEKQFGIDLDSDDLEAENYRSINTITALVVRKRGSNA